MTTLNANLRKAAVFMRSLDAETAAKMLAQLSPDEAAALRDAVRAVGPLDPEEQADVVAEFRKARPIAAEPTANGVELTLTSAGDEVHAAALAATVPAVVKLKRFEFLEKAPIEALIPYLAREHVQTIAVVISHLAPPRAAAVISALPDRLQAETLERLATLGETDAESVVVVEQELASWLAQRTSCRLGDVRRNETVAAILAAIDGLTRSQILANLRRQKSELADRLGRSVSPNPELISMRRKSRSTGLSHQAAACAKRVAAEASSGLTRAAQHVTATRRPVTLVAQRREPVLTPAFDELVHLDARTLAAVLREVDVNVIVLALAGSQEELAHRVRDQVPKRVARTIRRQLRQLGPTRLSDVEEAQRAVSLVAARHIAARRHELLQAATT